MLELEIPAPAPVEPSGPPAAGEPVVEATGSLVLWGAVAGIYEALGFTEIGDDAFRALVWGGSSNPPARWTRSACWTSSGSARRLAASGLSNPEIATELHLSRSTVETHLKRVYANLPSTAAGNSTSSAHSPAPRPPALIPTAAGPF